MKLIHIIKRLQVIDRDLEELRQLEDQLTINRSYSDSLRISVELQINTLLNERIKLMELQINNPPDSLLDMQYNVDADLHKKKKLSLDDYESAYLQRSLQSAQEPNLTPVVRNPNVTTSKNIPEGLAQGQRQLIQINQSNRHHTTSSGKYHPHDTSGKIQRKNKDIKTTKPSNNISDKVLLLKQLPPIEY